MDRRGLPDRHRRTTQLKAGGVSWDVEISYESKEDYRIESAVPTECVLEMLEHFPATQQILDLLEIAVVEILPELMSPEYNQDARA